jgi:NAD-dependent DNA ligase
MKIGPIHICDVYGETAIGSIQNAADRERITEWRDRQIRFVRSAKVWTTPTVDAPAYAVSIKSDGASAILTQALDL